MPTRREFLSRAIRLVPVVAGGSIFAAALRGRAFADSALEDLIATSPVARYWTSVERAGSNCAACHEAGLQAETASHLHSRGLVRCLLCAKECSIKPGGRGECNTRINVGGELRSLVYGRPLAVHLDPIEKKPFYHFLPGSEAFSLGTAGCPLHCRFCQNWQLSQARPEDNAPPYVAPHRVVESTAAQGSKVIAFTYNEPTVQTEFITDVSKDAKRFGIRCVIVSCGFMTEAPLADLCDSLAAVKIDLKGFGPDFYKFVCRAELKPVLRSIVQVARRGVHLELVNLVVPTLNDSLSMMEGLSDWVMGEIGPDVPVHFTRFHPDYQLQNLPPTPIATLERARDIAMKKGIHFAYVGNVPGHPGNNTYCPGCGKVVIARSNFFVTDIQLDAGRCRHCRRPIPGVWS